MLLIRPRILTLEFHCREIMFLHFREYLRQRAIILLINMIHNSVSFNLFELVAPVCFDNKGNFLCKLWYGIE